MTAPTLRERLRGLRPAGLRLIHLAPVLVLLALSAWALASPLGSSPDDDYHLTSIWCAQDADTSTCQKTDDPALREVPEALVKSGCYIREPEISASCQESQSSFDPEDTVETGRGNWIGGYPPVFYTVMSAFVGPDIQVSAVVMRLVNALLFVALSTVLYLLLPAHRRPVLVWGWVISTVPLGLFIISSNNPSSWTVIGAGISWLALLGFFETEGRRRIGLGVLTSVATIMAAGSRSDGAVYVVLGMAVVAVLAFRPERRFWLSAILPAALLVVCALSVLSANQILAAVNGFGGVDPVVVDPGSATPDAGASEGEATARPPSLIGLLAFNLLNVPSLWAGALGTWALGWFDTAMPAVVGFAGIGVFVGIAFLGFGSLSRRKALALAGVGLVLIALPVYVLTKGGDRVGVEVQPRYLLPAIVVFAGLLALSAGRRRFRVTRGQAILVVVSLSVVQFIALETNLRRYLTGVDEQGLNLDDGYEWWWNLAISPMGVLVIGSLAYAAAIAIVVREVTGARGLAAELPLPETEPAPIAAGAR